MNRQSAKLTKRQRNTIAEVRPVYKIATGPVNRRAIETSFPIEAISDLAEVESWRKEIYRPIYHIHKWWAQRLGSVFRAIILGACLPEGTDIFDLFYTPVRIPDTLIYDPFMGSGTTLGEAHKMGCRVIGRDINPVSYFIVRNALNNYSESEVRRTFYSIEEDIADSIKAYYKARSPEYGQVDGLYYFWVKVVPCVNCKQNVDLFNRRIFVQHAYPNQHGAAKSTCPTCGAINSVSINDTKTQCNECHTTYNPQQGPANRAKATCQNCGVTFSIVLAIQSLDTPPLHRMYAKMVLNPNGVKQYLPIDQFDVSLYEKVSAMLKEIDIDFPKVEIEPGYNTDQVLNYNYRYWHQMFNDRQLLCLSLLANRISEIENESLRYLFACLFSGCLEFNNMFCSFKGEGTGAVRHMFSHHILKPERTPLEANLWGTPKSSGSFSTLFKTRILRSLAYRDNPFELRVSNNNNRLSGIKIFGINKKMGGRISTTYKQFEKEKSDIYLSCGSSSETSIASGVVDAVITDPPFFDNVHYSQLADFFYVWQRQILGEDGVFIERSTRRQGEVQQEDVNTFVNNLAAVFKDCHRVLKHQGLLIFTYHHSRHEGWTAIIEAVQRSGFYIEATYPVKSEMSVAVPKHQAKEPIDIDIIVICRKLSHIEPFSRVPENLLTDSDHETRELVQRFNKRGRKLSRNDLRVVLMSRLITILSRVRDADVILDYLESNEANINRIVEIIWNRQRVEKQEPQELQASLF